MSEHSLPENLEDWPDDANELLGVSFGVSPRDLRRAYNRLIRIYKPEQFPEHFRRIREAYEHLIRIAELFGSRFETFDPPPAEEPQLLPPPQESVAEDQPWTAGTPRPADEAPEASMPPPMRRPEEELDELWEEARAGRPAPAYQRLVQMTQQHAGRVELYQRLYWLLTLWPELDVRQVPADWLVQGLRATGLAGPLRELYREEVADEPAEALSERYQQLLDLPTSAGILADLFEWRIQAAMRLERWDILHKDLPQLQERFGLAEERLWLRLLFTLADGAAFVADAEAVRLLVACREEIARHEYLASSMSHAFDRFDLLMAASVGWVKLSTQSHVPVPLLRLLAASWTRPFAETRAALLEILDWIAETPGIWLEHLDTMRQVAPATLALFGELLDRFEATQPTREQHDSDVQRELALAFLAHLDASEYQEERYRLLLFCLREHITPEEMAEAAGGAWEQALLADWPLRYICRAYRLFWA